MDNNVNSTISPVEFNKKFSEFLKANDNLELVEAYPVEITETGTPGQKGFTRNYSFSVGTSGGDYHQFMFDDNWSEEDTVTVTFYSSQAPTSIWVWGGAYRKTDNQFVSLEARSLSLGANTVYILPAGGNCTFGLAAKSGNATTGNITVRVKLEG
ncbi:MAG: hypothetical protein LBB86_07020 [Oscillospiraceae bacterium]|nr:hypothetical protein [Oscillospiraceae bacterium]